MIEYRDSTGVLAVVPSTIHCANATRGQSCTTLGCRQFDGLVISTVAGIEWDPFAILSDVRTEILLLHNERSPIDETRISVRI